MLDTIKLGVPLTEEQHRQINRLASENESWQWVLLNPRNGELLFRKTKGVITTDGESFHRELRWDIPHDYSEGDCHLILEFSVPKYWYGHNIHLLYEWLTPLKHLREALNKQFEFSDEHRLTEVWVWKVFRADVCYAWRFPSQTLAQRYLDSLKRLHFPRKRPIIYDHSILFAGKTYSTKFYLKLPEYKAHDRKELLKANAALEWINYCEHLADGVLRTESTLRRQYLKKKGIDTVADLARSVGYVHWSDGVMPRTRELAINKIASSLMTLDPNFHHRDSIYKHICVDSLRDTLEAIYTHCRLNHHYSHTFNVPETGLSIYSDILGVDKVESVSCRFEFRDNLTSIARYLLTKFVGENAGMQRADEVETKLLETYKPVKAARLVSFWLYVQKFGSAKAKSIYGDRSYYYTKSELKKAGVTLIEPPSGSNVTVLERDFIQEFKMAIPSPFATNTFDDFRDTGNVLNFVPRLSGEDVS